MVNIAELLAVPLAHRGLHDAARPENSLVALQAAVDAGYGVELDVRVSADGEAVVFHDATLKRLTGHSGCVADIPARELARLRLCGTNQTIPTLAQMLEVVSGRVPLYVELKTAHRPGTLEKRVAALLAGYSGFAAVASFNSRCLAWFAHHVPQRPRVLVRDEFRTRRWRWHDKALALRAPDCAPHAVSLRLDLLAHPQARRLRCYGIPLLAWIVSTPEFAAMVGPLCDQIVFEGFQPEKTVKPAESVWMNRVWRYGKNGSKSYKG